MMPFFAASFPPNIQTCLGRPSFFLVIQASLLEKFLLLFSFLPLPDIVNLPLDLLYRSLAGELEVRGCLPSSSQEVNSASLASSFYPQVLSWQTSAFGW